MKKLLFLFLLCLPLFGKSQIQNQYLKDTSIYYVDTILYPAGNSQVSIQASCATPNGAMNVTAVPPPSYPWLQANGYCNPNNYGKTGTVCWTFTPTLANVNINSGYATTGCATVSFGPFNLYTCAPACTFVGSGLSFTLTTGQCYTWCMGYNATGPATCHFSDFCPYYQQSSPLPIDLLYFAGAYQNTYVSLQWVTLSEQNCNYFIIEKANQNDSLSWYETGRVNGSGTTTQVHSYTFNDNAPILGFNYYRLKQVDYNGEYKTYGIVVVKCEKTLKKILKVTNELGQEIDLNSFKGFYIIFYDDGSVFKGYRY